MTETETKTCTRCKQELAITEFHYYHKRPRPSARCKVCVAAVEREYRERNREKLRERRRKQNQSPKTKATRIVNSNRPEVRARRNQRQRQYYRDNRTKQRARVIAGQAKAAGDLTPQACQSCGSWDNLEMHHEDYTKPLLVQWFCQLCHIRLDWKRRKSRAAAKKFEKTTGKKLVMSIYHTFADQDTILLHRKPAVDDDHLLAVLQGGEIGPMAQYAETLHSEETRTAFWRGIIEGIKHCQNLMRYSDIFGVAGDEYEGDEYHGEMLAEVRP